MFIAPAIVLPIVEPTAPAIVLPIVEPTALPIVPFFVMTVASTVALTVLLMVRVAPVRMS